MINKLFLTEEKIGKYYRLIYQHDNMAHPMVSVSTNRQTALSELTEKRNLQKQASK
jgi:predicted acetyltransferase